MERYKFRLIHIPIFLLLLYCFVAIFFTPICGDELFFHYPNTQNISFSQIINNHTTYSSAYTPLPYILGSVVYKINGTIYVLRLLNYLILIILCFFIYKIAQHLKFDPLLLVLLIISNPYLIVSSFTYYMFNYGLLFTIIGIYYYFFSNFKYRQIISHLFFGLAILSQQWMLVVIFALFLNEIMQLYKKEISKKDFFNKLLLKVIFLLPALALFYQWGGLTHPNFEHHTLKSSFEHLNAFLANIGFAGIFLALYKFKKVLKFEYLPLLFIIPMFYFSIPLHSQSNGPEVSTGLAAQLSIQIHRFFFFPYQINMLVLIILGVVSLIMIILKNENSFSSFLKYAILGFATVFSISTIVGAIHIFLCIPFFFLIFSTELKENKLLVRIVTVQMYLTSIFYIIYWSFMVAKGQYL
ncbi:MAG: hypothetical protein P4L27_08940 [Ignavibacteriaceae bacterium]|nr:hypothetical protein [Ignavibacteriaceae bacterium]